MAWHSVQYVLGLHALGHDVFFVEASGTDDWSCYDPERDAMGRDATTGLRWAADAFRQLGLDDRWAYRDDHTGTWHGPAGHRMPEISDSADVVINVAGDPLPTWLECVPTRVFIDGDPLFQQVRGLTEPEWARTIRDHTAHFTYGENVGQPGCSIPDDGIGWLPTRQPVVLSWWPYTALGDARAPFTTVLQWDSYSVRTYNGIEYGMKSKAFEDLDLWSLPERGSFSLELAAGSPSVPRNELETHGWRLRDPREVTRTLWTYRRYIQDSQGEIGLTKHGYVAAQTGWFSERSAAYLATGRPVVAQDTGFGSWMETGMGVLPFSSLDEAVVALEDAAAHFARHSDAARALAEEYFEASKVLTSLLERACTPRSTVHRREQ
jgi:hypothetical protein